MADVGASAATRTFVFTDIEGSTRHLRRLGERYAEVLTRHDGIIRSIALRHGGEAFGSEGDAQFLAFGDPSEAVAAAAEMQRELAAEAWPDDEPIRVRMGIHTGTAQRAEGGYVGLGLHETARIAAAGHGGQVLISPTTEVLLRDLPDGSRTTDLGEHRLKDIERPLRLYQLDVEGVPTTFPALRTMGPVGARLPTQVTSFVGRSEVRTAVELLAGSRLVTLTGPGGTGKTRLSIAVAQEVAGEFVDGTFFVAVDAVADADLVASEIAAVLGIGGGSDPPIERLIAYLRERRVLLVLDNMEHVIDAAETVARLLRECPDTSFIVTSRIPLRIYGEQEFAVPALTLPPTDEAPTATSVGSYEAIRLFVDRAHAARPDFELEDANSGAVADIVRRLDGLPLAIELAAARLRMLSVEALAKRLDDRLATLTGGPRDLPGRQRTLRGAIEWSHDLLDEPDRRLFARFGAFAGSAASEQIETVCGPPDELGRDVLDGLESLGVQSLLRSLEDGSEPRFEMLPTIREYAVERLASSGEAPVIRRRHAVECLRLAELAAPQLVGQDGAVWNDRLEVEHDNLRAALDWTVDEDEGELGLRLIIALWRFWQVRGHLHEGGEAADRVLSMPSATEQPVELRARAEAAAGSIAYWRSQIPTMHHHYARSLELARASGDRALIAESLYNHGFAPTATSYSQIDRFKEGQPFFEEALEIYSDLADRPGQASALWALSQSALSRRDFATSERLGVESLTIARELGDPFRTGWAAFSVGLDRLTRGQPSTVSDLLAEALEIFVAADDAGGLTLVLMGVAMLANERDEAADSWRLLGAAIRARDVSGTNLLDEEVPFVDWDPHRRPDDAEGQAAFEEGRSMSTQSAVDLARDVLARE